ncbi:nSTAND1 domain-containing NTPase [Nocardia rhamnosiphila]
MSEGLELFPVAIGTYTHFDDLKVDTEVAEVAAALSDFDVEQVAWEVPSGQRSFDAVNARLNQWAKSARSQTILYWVGHGWSDGRDSGLAHSDSPPAVRTQGVSAQRIADAITTRTGFFDDGEAAGSSWVIVVVDACQSAAFVRELKVEVTRRSPDMEVGLLLIGGLAGSGATNLGRFSRELRFFLDTVCATDFTIPLHRMAIHFETQRAEVEQKWLIDEVVLRRRHSTLVNLDLDTRNQLLNALDALGSDELRHFLPKAYGGEMPFAETMLGEQSWYFQGRNDETRRITEWLTRTDTGMLIVTGPAGSGKSALLGHLVVHANPSLRTALHRAGLIRLLPTSEQPPDNVFDIVLHLTGATTDEVVARLAALTEHRTTNAWIQSVGGLDKAVNHLVETISRQRTRVTILVDALDEAVESLQVARRILAVLAETTGVRVVVGTRASTHESPDLPAPDTDLLDALRVRHTTTVPITAAPTAVASYVRQRLRSARTSLKDPSGTEIDVESLVADVRRREPQFLFARLLVHELLADPQQRTPAAWTRLLAGEHRSLFATAVDRLTAEQPAHFAVLKALAFARGRGLPAADDIWVTAAHAIATDPTTTISNADVERLTEVAAAYVLADREHGQTVFRLAHRTFTEHFTNDTEPTAADRSHHLAITDALITNASEHIEQVLAGTRLLNPYYTHYLPAHAAAAGQPGWDHLNPHTELLLALDPMAIATNAWRTSSGQYALPDTVAAITTLNTHLQPLEPCDRQLPINIERHHTIATPEPLQRFPPWAPPIAVQWTTQTHSSPHRILTGHDESVKALTTVVMPDGRTLLASAGSDHTVRLWDPVTGQPHGQPMTGHGSWVEALTTVVMPEPDGRTLLASGGFNHTVQLWDPVTGQPHGQPMTRPNNWVRALTTVVMPEPDGRTLLASGGDDGTVQLWDPVTGQPHGQPMTHPNNRLRALTTVVMPEPDGRTLLASGGSDSTVQLWDPVTGQPHGQPITSKYSWVHALTTVAMPDGHTLLASAGLFNEVLLWDPLTAQPHGHPMTGYSGWVEALTTVVMPDGRTLLASASSDGPVHLWDPVTGQPHGQPMTGHTDTVRALTTVAMPDGRTLLASGGDDSTVRLWDPVAESEAIGYASPTSQMPSPVSVLALTTVAMPDGHTLLASGGFDRTVRLWDPVTGQPHGQPMDGPEGRVLALTTVAMPDGRTLLAAAHSDRDNDNDCLVLLRDPVTGGHHDEIRLRGRRDSREKNLVLTLTTVVMPEPDGRTLLASAGSDHIVQLWDPVTGQPHGQTMTGHTGWVEALTTVTMPDGRTLLASAGSDSTVQLSDPVTGQPHGQTMTGHTGWVEALTTVTMPDGRTLLASAGKDSTVRLWNITNNEASLWLTLRPVPVPVVALQGIGDLLAVATQNSIIVVRVH